GIPLFKAYAEREIRRVFARARKRIKEKKIALAKNGGAVGFDAGSSFRFAFPALSLFCAITALSSSERLVYTKCRQSIIIEDRKRR
ncbi:MAG: hypothetical protein IK059_00165, partial [Firmicutes bacterium]|nr:hypothetical protein [Bacillota bacterium]